MSQGTIALNTRVNTQGFTQGFQRAGEQVQSFASSITNVLGKIGLASMGITALFNTVKSVVGEPLKLSANMETTATSFEVLLGSADKAKQVMESLKDFGKNTPFEFPEVAEAAKKFLAFGFSADKLIPTLTNIGNLASGMNIPFGELADLYGKLSVQGKITGEDINQMLSRGLPITKALADTMGILQTSVKDYASAGRIEFKHVEAAITNLTNGSGKFSGLMQRQSLTLQGTWSNFADTFKGILTNVGDKLVETFGLKQALDSVGNFATTASGYLFSIWDGIVEGANFVMPLVNAVGDAIMYSFNAVAEVGRAIWDSLTAGITVNVTKIKDDFLFAFDAITYVFKNFGLSAEIAAKAFLLGFVIAWNELHHVFTVAIPTVIDWFFKHWREVFTDIWNMTKTIFLNIGKNIANIFSNLWEIVKGNVSIADLWTPLTDGFESAISELPKIAARQMGTVEKQLTDDLRNLNTQWAKGFQDFRKVQEETRKNPTVKMEQSLITLPVDKAKQSQGIKIAASGSGKTNPFTDAFARGSKEAAQAQLSVMFATREKKDTKAIADNTKEAVGELKKLNQRFINMDTGKEVDI